jgi:hypothetical protein
LGRKRRNVAAILLLLQTVLFGWYAFAAFMAITSETTDPWLIGAGGIAITVGETLAAATMLVLGIRVWRDSSTALAISFVLGAMEVVVALPFVIWGAVWGSWGFLFLMMIFPVPFMAPGLLALPTLILCASLLRSRASANAVPVAIPPKP